MDSILAAAIGGAVGGVLGAVLGRLASRAFPEKARSVVRAAITVGAIAAGWEITAAVLATPSLTTAGPAEIERQIFADPRAAGLARAWQRAEPASFEDFVQGLSREARAGAPRDQLVASARARMMAAATPRLAHLGDADTLEIVALARAEYSELARTHPEVCRPMFRGEPFGDDLSSHLSADTIRRELSLMERAFSADMSVHQTVLAGPELDAAIADLIADVRTVLPASDIALLAPDADIRGMEARYCEVVAVVQERIAALPPARAAALMRGLRAASQGPA